MVRSEIVDGHGAERIALVRELFQEYAAWVQTDLCFQGFEAELAGLPGKYSPPAGAILLAYMDSRLAGCVAMRPLSSSVCEMKRLWLREGFRGLHLGQRLVREIMERGRTAGYAAIRLDTLPQMKSAIRLYANEGFYEIPAYYGNPVPGTLYLEARLIGGET